MIAALMCFKTKSVGFSWKIDVFIKFLDSMFTYYMNRRKKSKVVNFLQTKIILNVSEGFYFHVKEASFDFEDLHFYFNAV